jgi:hypothetical protein
MRRLDTPPYGFALPDETHLRALYERALHEPADAHDAFRAAVCAFTKRARNEGAPIERIIVALKDMLGVTVRLQVRVEGREIPPEQQLVDEAVRACIAQYYDP